MSDRLEASGLAEARGYLLEALEGRARVMAEPWRASAERLIAALHGAMPSTLPGASLSVDRRHLDTAALLELKITAPAWSVAVMVDASASVGLEPAWLLPLAVLGRVRADVWAHGLDYVDPPAREMP
jgi:hypothetical protein